MSDLLDSIMNKAIICSNNQDIFDHIMETLKDIGWDVKQEGSIKGVFEQIRANPIDMLIIENEVLNDIISLPITIRRKIFVVLLQDTIETNNKRQAFSNSVDLILNIKDIFLFKEIIIKEMAENNSFYQTYNQVLMKAGKF